MDRLYDALFAEGGLFRVRALLAFALTGASIYLWVTDGSVPDALLTTTAAADAFYFASRQ